MSAHNVTRDVTQEEECHWLPRTIKAGETVYRCTKPTYGAVRDFPATLNPDGDYPFFELPWDAITLPPTDARAYTWPAICPCGCGCEACRCLAMEDEARAEERRGS